MSRGNMHAPVLSVADALWRLHALDAHEEESGRPGSPKLRADLATQVGARLLQRYDALRHTTQPAVVQLEEASCPGCEVSYEMDHEYWLLEGSGEVRPCEGCGRLIAFQEASPFASAE